MKVLRAHDYKHVECIKHSLERMPQAWMQDIAHIPWIILPSNLSPLWIGLMYDEMISVDGRKYSEIGGWAIPSVYYSKNFRWQPHIYLSDGYAWAAIHEAARVLEEVWNAPVDELYKPSASFDDYMASNSSEYFACAVDAFLTPSQNDEMYNRDDLARINADIYEYLTMKACQQ